MTEVQQTVMVQPPQHGLHRMCQATQQSWEAALQGQCREVSRALLLQRKAGVVQDQALPPGDCQGRRHNASVFSCCSGRWACRQVHQKAGQLLKGLRRDLLNAHLEKSQCMLSRCSNAWLLPAASRLSSPEPLSPTSHERCQHPAHKLLTMLCTRKFMPEPGLSQEPVRPAKPSVTAYMALSRSLLKPKRSRYLATGCWHRLMKVCRHRQQGRIVERVQM